MGKVLPSQQQPDKVIFKPQVGKIAKSAPALIRSLESQEEPELDK